MKEATLNEQMIELVNFLNKGTLSEELINPNLFHEIEFIEVLSQCTNYNLKEKYEKVHKLKLEATNNKEYESTAQYRDSEWKYYHEMFDNVYGTKDKFIVIDGHKNKIGKRKHL